MQSSYFDTYRDFLRNRQVSLSESNQQAIQAIVGATAWEEPQSPLDFNNSGVMALVEAEQAETADVRQLYIELAIEAFSQAAQGHPLGAAHLALVLALMRDSETAKQIAIATVPQCLASGSRAALTPGLVYLPSQPYLATSESPQRFADILLTENGFEQAVTLLIEMLGNHLIPPFYNEFGIWLSHLATHTQPSAQNYLQLGVTHALNNSWQSLVYLHQAHQIAPTNPAVQQALYLAYRDAGLPQPQRWQQMGQKVQPEASDPLRWQWSALPEDAPFTYVQFADDGLLAVAPSLTSISTGILLVRGDWFEADMEFWRSQIQPGMTVIDVGANVGVYTLSAAQRVGKTGRVVAVEPFSGCLQCLEETRRINQLDWMTIAAGAASDHPGVLKLGLQSASELNEILSDEPPAGVNFEEVACFTLDSLVESEKLERVDFLKIDAEGHERTVLAGSDRLLEFQPIILYENSVDGHHNNLPVAEFLQQRGYRLFCYQPFTQRLVPIQSVEQELQGNLNLLAVPPARLADLVQQGLLSEE